MRGEFIVKTGFGGNGGNERRAEGWIGGCLWKPWRFRVECALHKRPILVPRDRAKSMLHADQNFEQLKANPYPGRGIIAGLSDQGDALIQIYWIMGRSENSRNRIFASAGGAVWTEAADPARISDPSLIIYNAMRELTGIYVATNGDQTDTIIQTLRAGGTAQQALATRFYEPDAPNFTPRISAVCSLRDGLPMIEMSVLKRSRLSVACERFFYVYDQLSAGHGHYISTYAGDGNPLPSFEGEPRLMPLRGTLEELAAAYWEALNEENRVSLAVKSISLASGVSQLKVVNRFEKAAKP